MIGFLSGSLVRENGKQGTILSWALPSVVIGWKEPGRTLPREEAFESVDQRLRHQVEVLSLDAGWVPLGHFMSLSGIPQAQPKSRTSLDDVHKLLGEAEALKIGRELLESRTKAPSSPAALTEAGQKHSPFKNKGHLGKGPRGREMDVKDYWDCKCANYKCQCTNSDGGKRKVKIKKGYKRAYNKQYKAWRAAQGK